MSYLDKIHKDYTLKVKGRTRPSAMTPLPRYKSSVLSPYEKLWADTNDAEFLVNSAKQPPITASLTQAPYTLTESAYKERTPAYTPVEQPPTLPPPTAQSIVKPLTSSPEEATKPEGRFKMKFDPMALGSSFESLIGGALNASSPSFAVETGSQDRNREMLAKEIERLEQEKFINNKLIPFRKNEQIKDFTKQLGYDPSELDNEELYRLGLKYEDNAFAPPPDDGITPYQSRRLGQSNRQDLDDRVTKYSEAVSPLVRLNYLIDNIKQTASKLDPSELNLTLQNISSRFNNEKQTFDSLFNQLEGAISKEQSGLTVSDAERERISRQLANRNTSTIEHIVENLDNLSNKFKEGILRVNSGYDPEVVNRYNKNYQYYMDAANKRSPKLASAPSFNSNEVIIEK